MERNRIAVLRKEQGMNQKERGIALGVGQTTVSAWETGKNEPDAASLHKMAQLFHVSIGYLIGYENDSHRGLSGAEYAVYEAQKEAQQMGEDESGLSAQERAELIREAELDEALEDTRSETLEGYLAGRIIDQQSEPVRKWLLEGIRLLTKGPEN